ncbi:MAG: ArgE/DapE family deacylase, partial [Vicinamibacteria bacterium]
HGAVLSLRDDLFDLASDLVKRKSVTGEEDDAQQAFASLLRDWGLDVDLWRIDPAIRSHPAFCDDGNRLDRLNLVARWGGREESAALLLNGHIDVVPEGERERWSSDPYSGEIRGGTLYGRGSCDMKGGLAAAAIAIRAAMKLGIEPRRPILFTSVVGEETGGLGTLAAIARGYRADAAVITEPTSLELCPVQAGALSFRLHVRGKSAHGAMRREGVSAVEKFWPVFRALESLERERHRGFRHPLYPEGDLVAPLSIGKVEAGNWPSTVPEELRAEGRFGIFPGEDCASAREAFEAAVRGVRDDPWFSENPVGVEWFEGQFEPGEAALDAPILDELRSAHREMLGSESSTHGVSYGSDLRLFTRYAEMPAVLYGPGDVRRAHSANESVPLEELVAAAEVLTLLIARRLDA